MLSDKHIEKKYNEKHATIHVFNSILIYIKKIGFHAPSPKQILKLTHVKYLTPKNHNPITNLREIFSLEVLIQIIYFHHFYYIPYFGTTVKLHYQRKPPLLLRIYRRPVYPMIICSANLQITFVI